MFVFCPDKLLIVKSCKGMFDEWKRIKLRWARVVFVLGVSVCLIGAFLMAFGEGIVGEDHTGIATVIGIVGIGLIATSGGGLLRPKKT